MRVTISGALMVCDCEDSGFPTMAFPVRPKPEVEFWLCAQGHAGWTAGGTRAYLRTFPPRATDPQMVSLGRLRGVRRRIFGSK